MSETIMRPNGKPYRPRKGLAVGSMYDEWEGQEYIYVLRTHDRDRAYAWLTEVFLRPTNRGHFYPTQRWASVSEGDPGALIFDQLAWLRELPFDPQGYYDRTIQHDPVRGTPAVVFRVDPDLPSPMPQYGPDGISDQLELTP